MASDLFNFTCPTYVPNVEHGEEAYRQAVADYEDAEQDGQAAEETSEEEPAASTEEA